jgi:hypothetical protein
VEVRKPPAGYSGTPLIQKLGIKPGTTIAILNPPDDFDKTLGPLPDDVTVRRRLRGPLDFILCFTTARADLEGRFPALVDALDADGALWISWPKRASGIRTDLTEDALREVALPAGLVDNKVCAVDETWSGLRLVVRRENRAAHRSRAGVSPTS